ncbi:MAG: hypothetical protein IPO58_25090 [Betaproteobacteria bacterium]|nr:hypothetical protein [Betaproteobacteria bacterium]
MAECVDARKQQAVLNSGPSCCLSALGTALSTRAVVAETPRTTARAPFETRLDEGERSSQLRRLGGGTLTWIESRAAAMKTKHAQRHFAAQRDETIKRLNETREASQAALDRHANHGLSQLKSHDSFTRPTEFPKKPPNSLRLAAKAAVFDLAQSPRRQLAHDAR